MGLRVVALDTGADKRALCEKLGVEAFVDYAESKDLVADVKTACGGKGPHAAIVTASSAKAYEQALDYLRNGGVLVVVGLPADSYVRGTHLVEQPCIDLLYRLKPPYSSQSSVPSKLLAHTWGIAWTPSKLSILLRAERSSRLSTRCCHWRHYPKFTRTWVRKRLLVVSFLICTFVFRYTVAWNVADYIYMLISSDGTALNRMCDLSIVRRIAKIPPFSWIGCPTPRWTYVRSPSLNR